MEGGLGGGGENWRGGLLEFEGAELLVDDLPDNLVRGHGGLRVGCGEGIFLLQESRYCFYGWRAVKKLKSFVVGKRRAEEPDAY